MVNRNILDQNGFNSRNILNIRNQKLKDGKAIKINTSITNKNEIDVNMKTNTTEQTTVGDTDLFLLSDTTGETIKYITGINLKQKALLHLEGGTNINLTINSGNGNTEINLDDNIDTAGSITCKNFVKINNSGSGTIGGILSLESSSSQSSFPNRFKLQTSHLNSRDKFQIIGEDNASNQQILLEIDTGTNNGNTHTIDFKFAELTNVLKINTYTSNNFQLNTNFDQFIIKKSTVNFSSGDILAVDSNNQLTNITATNIISSIVGGNNITRSVNTINLDTGLTGMVSIDGTATDLLLQRGGIDRVSIGSSSTRFRAFNTTLGGILLIDKGTGGQANSVNYEILHDYLSNGFITNKIDVGLRIRRKGTPDIDQLFCGHQEDEGNCVILNPNNDLNYIFKSGELKINKEDLSAHDFNINIVGDGSNLILRATTIKFFNGTYEAFRIPSATANTDNIDCFKDIDMNNNYIFFQTDIQTEYIGYSGLTSELDGLLYVGRGRLPGQAAHIFQSSSYTPNTDIMKMYEAKIEISRPLFMQNNQINFKTNDTTNYIKHSGGTGFDGLEYTGNGSSSQVAHHFTASSTGTDLIKMYEDKINLYKPLYMNSTTSDDRPIYLHTNTDFFIKYQNDSGQNVVECKGFNGVHLGSTGANNLNLKVEQDRVEIGGYAGVIQDNRTNIPLSQNDTLIVRNEGLATLRVRSFTNNATFLLQSGNNFNASITYTGSQLRIETVGQEFRVEVANNTCNFVNNNGRLAWQSDRNLVIYDSGGSAIFSSNTGISERRFKDNIVSLDLENSYNIIKQLNPVSFVYKEDINTLKKGFIVDEIEDKIPECIKEITNCDCEDMKSKLLYKEDIVPDLVASVKFLINKVESLTEQLITQSALISNLQSQINNI